jgi:hypothetical protein
MSWLVPKAVGKPRHRTLRASAARKNFGGVVGAMPGVGPAVPNLRDWEAISKIEKGIPSHDAEVQPRRAVTDLGWCPVCRSEEYSQRPIRA